MIIAFGTCHTDRPGIEDAQASQKQAERSPTANCLGSTVQLTARSSTKAKEIFKLRPVRTSTNYVVKKAQSGRDDHAYSS